MYVLVCLARRLGVRATLSLRFREGIGIDGLMKLRLNAISKLSCTNVDCNFGGRLLLGGRWQC
ncbi:MAG: hypothetical protein ACTS44_01380 [Candidatus Hodgkinia cicadicola]